MTMKEKLALAIHNANMEQSGYRPIKEFGFVAPMFQARIDARNAAILDILHRPTVGVINAGCIALRDAPTAAGLEEAVDLVWAAMINAIQEGA